MIITVLIIGVVLIAIIIYPELKTKNYNPYQSNFINKENSTGNKIKDVPVVLKIIKKVTDKFPKLVISVSEQKEKKIKRDIIGAGIQGTMDVGNIIGAKIIFSLITLIYFSLLLIINYDDYLIILCVLAMIIAYMLPERILSIVAKRRQEKISQEIPSILTSLAIITDAGMNLVPAMETLVSQQRGENIFATELKKLIEEIHIGISIKEAMQNLDNRINLEEVHYFSSAIIQGVEKGNSGLSSIIRQQADECFQKRLYRAKEMADQASIKLFLPLLFLVFPAFAIFLMGPMIFTLINLFSIM